MLAGTPGAQGAAAGAVEACRPQCQCPGVELARPAPPGVSEQILLVPSGHTGIPREDLLWATPKQ